MWKRTATPILVMLCTVSLCAMAQPSGPPPGGPGGSGGHRGPARMTAEQCATVWGLQAANVAGRLSLNDEETTKLATAYKAARTQMNSSSRSQMQPPEEGESEGGTPPRRGRGGPGGNEQQMAAYQENLKAALAEFLSATNVEETLALLGNPDRQWDQMVLVLSGFELGDKLNMALTSVNDYVVDCAKLRPKPGAEPEEGTNPMEAMQARKTKLDNALALLLTSEQLTEWKNATSHGPGGRPGPPRNAE